jgi:hypothetical protein
MSVIELTCESASSARSAVPVAHPPLQALTYDDAGSLCDEQSIEILVQASWFDSRKSAPVIMQYLGREWRRQLRYWHSSAGDRDPLAPQDTIDNLTTMVT